MSEKNEIPRLGIEQILDYVGEYMNYPEIQSIRTFVQNNEFECTKIYHDVLSATQYRLPLARRVPLTHEEKVNILIRIKKEWTEQENIWRLNLSAQELSLKCRSTRSPLTGAYSYFDIETNTEVSSEEYRCRYIAFLADCKKKKKRKQTRSSKL